MYPYFPSEYILIEHDLGRSDFLSFHRSYSRAAPSAVPAYPEKTRSVPAKAPLRSTIKEKSAARQSAAARANELDSTLSCLASLFQGMYTSTLCRLMME